MCRAISLPASLAVLLALIIGSVLFSSPERATASDDAVTTVLQPGWNLVGWTQAEANIEAIFDDMPRLEVAYAWDAENQWFVSAVPTDSGALGDLRRLTPGMGLFLWVGGEQQFRWTRTVNPQAANAPLHEGWNLAVWVGEGGVRAAEALQEVNPILTAAQDADGRCGQHPPAQLIQSS